MKDNYLYQWETHIIHPLDYSTITVHTFIEETNNQEAITKRKLYQRQHIRHYRQIRTTFSRSHFFKENFAITIEHITSTCQKTQQYKKTRNYSIPMQKEK